MAPRSRRAKKEIEAERPKNEGSNPQHRPWADLPQELLTSIARNCGFMDQFSFRRVCKKWNSIERVTSTRQLPWLVVAGSDSSKMYDPYLEKEYKSRVHLMAPYWNLPETRFYGAKFGWLLLTSTEGATTFLYFYNPFTGDQISLPLLSIGETRKEFDVVAFSISSAPSSPGCTCITFGESTQRYSFAVATCCVGDTEWITRKFEGDKFYPRRDIAYSNGTFYFAESSGRLATFNVAQQQWSIIIGNPEFHNVDTSHLSYSTHMVESEGEILLIRVYSGSPGEETACVWRVDLEEKGWVEVKTLGKRALFLGNGTSLAFRVTARNDEEIEDKIYTRNGEGILKYYCLEGLDNGTCSPLYGSLANKPRITKFWIMPPS